MRVIVTGASGFVGSAITRELLAAGIEVEAWHGRTAPPPGADARQVDLLAELPAAGPSADAVVHAAALAHARPDPELLDRLFALNVGGTAKMLHHASAVGARRFVLISSVKAQGMPAPGWVGVESDPPHPEGPYGEAKRQAELLVEEWARQGEREAIALRLPLVYGPAVRGNLAAMARAARRGWLPRVGDGSARRSLVSVNNVASAVEATLTAPAREPSFRTYLLTDERPYSVAELGDALAAASPRSVRQPVLPLPIARALARFGDLGQRIARRPLPFSSEVLSRLAGDAVFSSAAFQRDYGWAPRGDFADQAGAILSSVP